MRSNKFVCPQCRSSFGEIFRSQGYLVFEEVFYTMHKEFMFDAVCDKCHNQVFRESFAINRYGAIGSSRIRIGNSIAYYELTKLLEEQGWQYAQ